MFRLLKKINKTETVYLFLSLAFIVTQVYLDLKVPEYMSDITILISTPGTELRDLFEPGGMMILLSLLSLLAAVVTGYFVARIAAGLSMRLRGEVYERVMDYSPNEVKNFSIPSLITRTTNDITQIQTLVAMGLQVVVRGPIMAVWAITKISNKHMEWTILTIGTVVVMVLIIMVIMSIVQPKFKMIQKMTDSLNALTRENLVGIRVVRAYNGEKYQHGKFMEANEGLTGINLFVGRMLSLMQPFMSTIMMSMVLGVYWLGAIIINSANVMDRLPIFSDMIVFTSYAMQVVMGFMMMLMIFMFLPRALVSAKRINEVLDLESAIKFDKEKEITTSEKGVVEFNNVSFKYPEAEEYVIENISFKAEKGQTVAFIGSTGSGKSTVVNLIPRFYDATNGEILINGVDIKKYAHTQLNDIVGYIPQKAVIFSGTIESNMNFGDSAVTLTEEEIYKALEIGQAKNFVEEKDDKLQAHVAQSGNNFSGGQKQRLAISRAIARKSEILIFDDSFSALDYRTDKELRAALNRELTDTTKLIVAQRISTIMDADQIIVLDQGQIVGQGTHSELLKSNKVYQEIAYSQLSKEELENA